MLRSTALATAIFTAALAASGCDDEKKEEHFCTNNLAVGSGYPSTCLPEEGCPDAGICGAISPTHDVGVCTIPCSDDADCAVDIGCTGKGRCILQDTDAGSKVCAYTCEDEADCPPSMTCTGYSGLNLCYPAEW